MRVLSHANHAAREASPRVAGGLARLALGARLAVVALAQVVRQLVDHHRAGQDAAGPGQRDLGVGQGDDSDAILTSRDVAQVTRVALLVTRRAVGLASRVEVRP
jgi:hypothetical protein